MNPENTMKHNPILMTTLIASCAIGFHWLAYLAPSHPYKKTQFEINQTQAIYDQAALSGARLGLGLPPTLIGKGIAHFTLKNLKGIQFHIPREHLGFTQDEADGEMDMICMTFYLPDMVSTSNLLKHRIYSQNFKYRVRVALSTQSRYIHCWGDQCLDQPFALFQSAIRFFQQSPEKEVGSPQPISLKNKFYSKTLRLDGYQGRKSKHLKNTGIVHDTVYLPPKSNPYNPGEWMQCEGYACNQFWFRNGMRIKTLFSRDLVSRHAEIRKKVNMKIDEYMKKT